MRQAALGVQPRGTLDRRRSRRAGEHQLTHGEAAERLQVVEVVVQSERARLRAEHRACVLPAQRRRARDFGGEFVAQYAQPRDPRGVWHTGVIRE